MQNKILIVGGAHINTLGLIRVFGENHICPYLFLVGQGGSYITKCKDLQQYWHCEDEESATKLMIENFKNETFKPVVFATTDKAASYFDFHFQTLSKYFIMPSIQNKQDNINFYMDKLNQYFLFRDCGIKCLKSELFDLQTFDIHRLQVSFPCVAKPHISAKGVKSDIEICLNEAELKACINRLIEKDYSSILLQDYCEYDFEYDVCGFSYNQEVGFSGLIKKIHIWPKKNGSTSYGLVLPVNEELATKITSLMKTLNYNGLFDIDLFEKNGEYYFNEINFRNSALSYAFRENHPAYYWYLSNVKQRYCPSPKIEKDYYFMNEKAEFRQVLSKNISLAEYFREKKACKILLIKNNRDPIPSRMFAVHSFKRFFKKFL